MVWKFLAVMANDLNMQGFSTKSPYDEGRCLYYGNFIKCYQLNI